MFTASYTLRAGDEESDRMERVPIRLGRLRTSVAPASPVAIHAVDTGVNAGSAGLAPASVARVCRVCTQHESRYTCPRCNTPYCGVACYKAHGEACTEQFFEQHVRSELQLMTNENKAASGGQQQQRQVAEMLERVRDFQQLHEQRLEEEDDDDAGERLAQRMLELALLDEQGELSLDALTEQERARFLSEVADGRLGKFVALWSPWWLLDERTYRRETSARRRSLIMEEVSTKEEEMGPTSDEEVKDPTSLASAGAVMIQPEHAFPAHILTDKEAKRVPRDWSEVLSGGRAPSPSLRFHLVEVLFAYALVMRAFNGDYLQDVSDAAALLLHLSAVLRADARYESLEHVLLVCFEKRMVAAEGAALEMGTLGSSSDGNGRDKNQVALHDVAKLLQCQVFVLDALRDAQALVEAYKDELTTGAQDADKQSTSKAARKERRAAVKRLSAVEKKLEFFLMWAVLADRSDLEALAIELEAAVNRN